MGPISSNLPPLTSAPPAVSSAPSDVAGAPAAPPSAPRQPLAVDAFMPMKAQLAISPSTTRAMVLVGLNKQLEDAAISPALRGELMTRLNAMPPARFAETVDGLKTALSSTNPKEGVADVRTQLRIDSYMDSSAKPYQVDGKTVKVPPFFRIHNGLRGPSSTLSAEVFAATERRGGAFNAAVAQSVTGRASPEQLRVVTQALIEKGKLDEVRKKYNELPDQEFKDLNGDVPRPLSDENAIKLLQWEYGLGIDCAGYVQQAFLDVKGASAASLGLRDLNNEDLSELKNNPRFERAMTPVKARPGDLVFLNVKGGRPQDGHTLLIRGRHDATEAERKDLRGFESFAKPTDKVHVLEADASWGANYGNVVEGGVQRRQFLYNENTKQWADVTGGAVVPTTGPYNGHIVEGFFHLK